MASKRNRYTTRDPQTTTRDPQPEQPQQRKPRRCIAASMPTVCPDCGHSTRMDDGRHVDPVRGRIVEYRTCSHCGIPLGAVRNMTPIERERLCRNSDIVAEYEQSTRAE